ncbi:MAG: DUF1444 family protein [Armatimonadota bacterium]
MEQGFWLLLLTVITYLMLRWLMAWSTTPLNAQAIRTLFIQYLLTMYRGAELVAEQEDAVSVKINDVTCAFRLDQLFRRCLEDPQHANQLIQQAIQGIHAAFHDEDPLPENWEQRVMATLVSTRSPLPPDLVSRPFTDALLIAYTLDSKELLRWISCQDLMKAGISEEALHDIAFRNLERSCNALVIETQSAWTDQYDRLVRFATADGYDAARLLIPSFFQRFSPRFGDADLLVAIPTRDTLAMTSAQDEDFARLLAWRTGKEYQRRAFPLYDGVLMVTEQGVRAWRPDEYDFDAAPGQA